MFIADNQHVSLRYGCSVVKNGTPAIIYMVCKNPQTIMRHPAKHKQRRLLVTTQTTAGEMTTVGLSW
jgi:hypothetical protein